MRSPHKGRVLLSNGEQPVVMAFATTENVSTNGARIQTDRPWKEGTRVLLKSALGELWGQARVVYCQRIPPDSFAVGLEFVIRTGAWMKPR